MRSLLSISKFGRAENNRRFQPHVSEAELLPPSPCSFCGQGGGEFVHLLQRKPDVRMLRCGQCRALYAESLPKEEVLNRFYAGYYDHVGDDITLDAPDAFASYLFRILSPHLNSPPETLRILDFGGANGYLARKLAEHFIGAGSKSAEIAVVDYGGETLTAGTDAIRLTKHASLEELGDKTFHMVLISSVIEHLPDPGTPLNAMLSRHMDAGSLLYVRSSYWEKIIPVYNALGLWLDLIYPEHMYDLGDAFWNGLFENVYPELAGSHETVHSRPSRVETSFSKAPVRTMLAHLLKSLYFVSGKRLKMVGGWEVVYRRRRGLNA